MADKWLMYEESIRVPAIIFDPAMPKEQRNRVLDPMTLNIDFCADDPRLRRRGDSRADARQKPASVAARRNARLAAGLVLRASHGNEEIIPPSEVCAPRVLDLFAAG